MVKKSNNTESNARSTAQSPRPTVEMDPNNIIVRFDDDVSEKERVSTRKKYKVTQFKTCSCGDKNLELWGLDIADAFIAKKTVRGLQEDQTTTPKGKRRAKGEHQFTFSFPEAENFEPMDGDFSGDMCISGKDGAKVNIAVLDTGIDLRYFNDVPFLYNTSGLGDCPGYVGWNFRGEGSYNVFDDHGHGTYVTKIITETLKAKGIGYRILPLKVLDSEGKGSFWNLLCAMSYLQKIQKEGTNIHLVNASLGATIEVKYFHDSDLFNTMVKELENNMLVIASAGNEGVDTDSGNLRHSPSSYTAENILAVGGYQEIDGELAVHPESNYGKDSIDLAVPFKGYKIDVNGLPIADDLEGTSYGTAYITALAAEFYMNHANLNPSPLVLKKTLLDSANIEPNMVDKINGGRAIIR